MTVIQAVALAEMDGLNDPNAYGHKPLTGNDPAHPEVKDGPENDYWDHVDFVVAKANSLGLYVGFLPTWGDKWNGRGKLPGRYSLRKMRRRMANGWAGGIATRESSGFWAAIGQSRTSAHREILRARPRGCVQRRWRKSLITFHPNGGAGSAEPSSTPNLGSSFNMRQNGHTVEYTDGMTRRRSITSERPMKPVIDGEPVYEDHPVAFRPDEFGHTIAADVRRPLYWDLFNGALRAHLRTPLGMADVCARPHAHQPSSHDPGRKRSISPGRVRCNMAGG